MIEARRRSRVAGHVGIEVNHRHNHAVFHFAVAQLVQVGLPAAILGEVVGDAFRDQDVAGVAAIHHALGDVDPGPVMFSRLFTSAT